MKTSNHFHGTLAVCLLATLASSIATAAEPGAPLSIALNPPSANRIVFLIAHDEGIFEKYGVDVELYVPAGAAAGVRRDGMIIPADVIKDQSPGADHIATGLGTNLALVTSDATMPRDMVYVASFDNVTRGHIVVAKDIKSKEELKGRRLGCTGGSRSHFVALVLAEHMGWDPGGRHLTNGQRPYGRPRERPCRCDHSEREPVRRGDGGGLRVGDRHQHPERADGRYRDCGACLLARTFMGTVTLSFRSWSRFAMHHASVV
jgi:hypothetical protein